MCHCRRRRRIVLGQRRLWTAWPGHQRVRDRPAGRGLRRVRLPRHRDESRHSRPGLSEEGFSTCGITTGGAALCWGDSRLGQVGNGSKTEVALPAAAGLSSVGSIGIGPEHACAIAVTTRYCWGSNNGGLLGNGGSLTGETCGGVSCRSTPLALDGGYTAGSLTVGVRHSCALAGGSAYCWGSSGSSPTAVPGVSFTRISAGDEFTCGISNGSAYCWGTNGAGQLGIGSQSAQATPAADFDRWAHGGRRGWQPRLWADGQRCHLLLGRKFVGAAGRWHDHDAADAGRADLSSVSQSPISFPSQNAPKPNTPPRT